jgi:Flp pilus assembly protein TadG
MSTQIAKRATRTILKAIRSVAVGNEGSAALEFTIFAPILLGGAVCTMDLGLGMYRNMQVQHSAQAGAQYAISHGYDSAAISSAVTQATTYTAISASPAPNQFCGCPSSTGVTSVTCGSTCTGGVAAGTYVTVSAGATYSTLVPYHAVLPAISNSFNLARQATVRIK